MPMLAGRVTSQRRVDSMTKSQLFAHAHAITRLKNLEYFGGYQKAFAHVLRQCYAKNLGYDFRVVEPRHLWA